MKNLWNMTEKSSSELLLVSENEPFNDSNIFHTNSNFKDSIQKIPICSGTDFH